MSIADWADETRGDSIASDADIEELRHAMGLLEQLDSILDNMMEEFFGDAFVRTYTDKGFSLQSQLEPTIYAAIHTEGEGFELKVEIYIQNTDPRSSDRTMLQFERTGEFSLDPFANVMAIKPDLPKGWAGQAMERAALGTLDKKEVVNVLGRALGRAMSSDMRAQLREALDERGGVAPKFDWNASLVSEVIKGWRPETLDELVEEVESLFQRVKEKFLYG